MAFRHSLPLVMLVTVAVGAQNAGVWRIQDAPRAMQPVIARADLVIAEIQDSVLRELSERVPAGTVDLAVRRTHFDVSLLLYRLRREGIVAGRTSDRLRNRTNRPPRWAEDMIGKWAGHQARDIDGYAVDLGDRIGVMRPVVERAICGNCHGTQDQISPRVREILWQTFPTDRAVGFREGEIRGWYWVEMPKPHEGKPDKW